MPTPFRLSLIRPRRSLFGGALAIACCLLVGGLVYRAAFNGALGNEREATGHRLAFYALSLEASLARYEALPGLLALERDLLHLLEVPAATRNRDAANRYLEAAQLGAGVAAAYLIDRQGNTLAASNWRQEAGFVGQNYAFRPYFQEAIAGRVGRFYGIGATTGEPGFFLSAPVRSGNRIVGVVAIKVSLEPFEQALAKSGDTVLLADRDGVVFLSSVPAWRYRTLTPLADAVRSRLLETRQYGGYPLLPLAQGEGIRGGAQQVLIAGDGTPVRARLQQIRQVAPLGWQLVVLVDPSGLRRGAWVAAAAAAFAAAFSLSLAVYFRLRRRRREELQCVHAELEARIAERTSDLSRKIEELKQTEAILRTTRDSAVQAGKLAVLGQMSAGMSHELNQPLAALHTFSDNAAALLERGRIDEVRDNLQMISQLAERMGRIVGQLKAFARKAPVGKAAVRILSAVDNALLIVEPRRRELGAQIGVHAEHPETAVVGEQVRIEQVLLNLLRNGLDAMVGQAEAQLDVSITVVGAFVRIAVCDHGPGIPPETLPHLFEPFFTTKPVGEGLGLGLSISLAIVEGFGGRLEAANVAGAGAEFAVLLPLAKTKKEKADVA